MGYSLATTILEEARADRAVTMDVQPIAVVQGAESPEIQALFEAFVARLPAAVRVAGVIEEHPTPAQAICDPILHNLRSGRRHPLFQDLGPGSTSCGLDPESVVVACQEVVGDIEAGCDLVVLSKFGRLEAERTGLLGAFAAAIEARRPILTSVSPRFEDAWRRFAAPLFLQLPPDPSALDHWWAQVQQRAPHAYGPEADSLSA
jgi:hypothetical protein